MEVQMTIGDQLAEQGAQAALDHADRVHESWSEKAYRFLREFSSSRKPFLTEDVRAACKDSLEEPPDNRAWGGVIRRAYNEGWITHVGFRRVKNPQAHSRPASLWVRA